MVPEDVEITIELPFPAGTLVPWFCATMPLVPALISKPGVVVILTAPNVEIAEMPLDVVPVIEPPATIWSGAVPLVRAPIPTVWPDTLP